MLRLSLVVLPELGAVVAVGGMTAPTTEEGGTGTIMATTGGGEGYAGLLVYRV